MTVDLVLAVLHHLVLLALVGAFAAEMVLVRNGLSQEGVRRVARVDGLYGGLAGAILVIGFARVFFGLRGWEFYGGYWVFWAKVAAFVVMGLFSVQPTMRIRRWLGQASADAAYVVPDAEIAAVRVWLMRQGAVLLLIPVFAAMMARGVGY